MTEEEKLDMYVRRLMDAYVRLRRRLKPTFHKLGNPRMKAWVDCANCLLISQLDPYQYMQWVFDKITVYRPDVYENEATSVKMVNAFANEKDNINDRLELEVKLQAAKIKTLLDSGEKLENLLNNPLYELSAPIRFATAWSEGMKELAEQFRLAASEAIMFRPHYAVALKEFLPEDMTNVNHPA